MAVAQSTRSDRTRVTGYVWSALVVALIALLVSRVTPWITGSDAVTASNAVFVLGATGVLSALALLAGRRLERTHPRTRRAAWVAAWLLLMTAIIGGEAVDIVRDEGVLMAVPFVAVMALFVYALWDFFPGYADEADAEPDESDLQTPRRPATR